MLSPDLLSRLTKSKNTSLIWGRHHFLDLKAFRKTLNTSWFAYLSVSSSLMIEGKAFSFWIFCGVAFDRTYAPVISRTFSCTNWEGLVAFPYQCVIKCSFKSSSELLNRIRMGWKLPLFTDATVVLSSGWPLREMFCLPHNIMVLFYVSSYFCQTSLVFAWKFLNDKVFFGFWALWISATLVSSALLWHCIFWRRSSAPSLPVAFFTFWMELLQVAFSVLEHPSCITQCLQKPPIWQGLYTSHLYASNHKGWKTSFLECLSFPLTTVPEKRFEYDGGGLK